MRSERGVCALVVFLLLCMTGAQTPPYGTARDYYANVKLDVSLAIPRITADGQKISGTYVQVKTEATAKNHATDPPQADPVAHVRVYKATLKIGTETIFEDVDNNIDWNDPEPEPSQLWASATAADEFTFPLTKDPRDVDFASTHFAHGTELAIELTVEFKFKRQSGSIDTQTKSVTSTITPQVHNYGVLWRTNWAIIGNDPPTELEMIEGVPPATYLSAEYNALKSAFEAANYEVGGEELMSRSAIANHLPLVTSLAAPTHGGMLGVQDSLSALNTSNRIKWSSDTPNFKDRLALNGDRYASTMTSNLIPPVSLVVFYACSTHGYALPTDFWLSRHPINGPVVNGAILGFDQDVPMTIDATAHVTKVFAMLASGRSVEKAVEIANFDTPLKLPNAPRSDPGIPLKIYADKHATFSKVYLPASVRAQNEVYDHWYRISPSTW